MAVNHVIILGNLGDEPKTRHLPDGTAITNLSVATSENYKDKSTGEKKTKTEWHRVSFFGRLAEIAAEYLRKGSKVYLEGSLKTQKYQDKDGKDCYSTSIVGSKLQLIDKAEREDQPKPEAKSSYTQSQPLPDDYIPF